MKAPMIARVLGIAFLLAGILGFVPYVTVPADLTAQWVTLGANYGFLGGLFPVNVVHDLIHVLFGVWGLAASGKFAASVRYCRAIAWIYAILVVLGAIPITNTVFGIVPIYGFDVLLHLVVALLAFYGGYGAGRYEPTPLEAPAASTPPPVA
ncbi:MAG TPA: DUF4383 domain-containing protein [Candidatus Baltobacteraceae bacterium]